MKNPSTPHAAIDLVIHTKYELTSACIKQLLESKSEINVVGTSSSDSNLYKEISNSKPDVVLFVLSDNNDNATEAIIEVTKKSPIHESTCPFGFQRISWIRRSSLNQVRPELSEPIRRKKY